MSVGLTAMIFFIVMVLLNIGISGKERVFVNVVFLIVSGLALIFLSRQARYSLITIVAGKGKSLEITYYEYNVEKTVEIDYRDTEVSLGYVPRKFKQDPYLKIRKKNKVVLRIYETSNRGLSCDKIEALCLDINRELFT